mgnify:CR=1 FL=1
MQFFGPETLEIFGQLALATLLGALIGVERELARKTAGMRTFALVSLGSALFTIISQIAFVNFVGSSFDPSRIASQVVVGIGFIGAGMIVLDKSHVRGLTTAAGFWVSAAVGMAVAYHFYAIATFGALLTIFILVFLWFVEREIKKRISVPRPDDDEKD